MLWTQIPTLCIFVNRILLWCVMFFLNFTFIEMKITLNKTGTSLYCSFQIAKFYGIKLNGKFEQQNLMGNIRTAKILNTYQMKFQELNGKSKTQPWWLGGKALAS